jgi:CelD/BcsL family acetyltransferase involved in cellulose biosynthesis
MAEVLEINDIDQLAHYRMVWDALLPATPRASFYHTLDWLTTYWRHFGHDQRLRVLIVSAAGKPIGILPLCVRTEQHNFGKVRVLAYPLDDWGMWYGPIGPNQAATMFAAMQHIRHTERDWDMIELRWNGPDKVDGGRATRAMRVAGLLTDRTRYQTTSVIDVPYSWDDFLDAKSRKYRHECRRVLRRVFDDRHAQYINYRPAPARSGDGDPRWDLYAMCEQVAQASWQADSTTGNTLTHDRVRGFLRDAHAAAARLGMVDINLLLVDGQPAAFGYNYHCQGRLVGLRVGYDAKSECSGLGNALLLSTVKSSCRYGDRAFDLGAGDWVFKRRLRTRSETSYRLTYTPIGSWRSQAVRLARWVKARRPQVQPAQSKPASA